MFFWLRCLICCTKQVVPIKCYLQAKPPRPQRFRTYMSLLWNCSGINRPRTAAAAYRIIFRCNEPLVSSPQVSMHQTRLDLVLGQYQSSLRAARRAKAARVRAGVKHRATGVHRRGVRSKSAVPPTREAVRRCLAAACLDVPLVVRRCLPMNDELSTTNVVPPALLSSRLSATAVFSCTIVLRSRRQR